MPKRKLPRLWYSKNSYKKDRENEDEKLPEPVQENNVTQPTIPGEVANPVDISNNGQQIESESKTLSVENLDQPAETEGVSNKTHTDTEKGLQQNEKAPTSTGSQVQNVEEDKETQVEPHVEPPSTQGINQQALAESNSIPLSTEKEMGETTQVDENEAPANAIAAITEAPKETQIMETLTESKSQVMLSETQSQTEFKETSLAPLVQAEVSFVDVEDKVPLAESIQNIEKYTDTLKRLSPTKAVICIGEYLINIMLKSSFASKKDKGVLPIFVEKSSKDVVGWSQGRLDEKNIICLDEDIDTHFWYDILPFIVENESFFSRVKNKSVEKLQGAIMVSSTWNGIGSALLPGLHTQFKEWNINSIAIPLLPSKAQPLDNQFNSFASIGILASKEATVLLFDRDNVENYTGIDRNGFAMDGNTVINYLLDLMLAKETFVQELCELSNSFDTRMFTVLLASGVSLKIYDSIENMLNTTMLRPLFNFDLSSSTLLYVLVRMPFQLKEKLPRGRIELAMANWFKDKANLESIYIADPIYVEESGDRIDIALFVGGFETATRFAALEKRVMKMKNQAVKKGSIAESDWQAIAKNLIE